MKTLPPLVDGIGALASRFDGFILVQWGVLHDGTTPYPGAMDALARLRATGKRIAILSNSGKRAAPNAAQMAKMGFPPSLYDVTISAGEDTYQNLKHRRDPFYAALGRRCVVLMRPADSVLLESLDLEIVGRLDDADFVLLIGLDPARPGVEAYEPFLREAAGRPPPSKVSMSWTMRSRSRSRAWARSAKRTRSPSASAGRARLPAYSSAVASGVRN